MLPLLPAALAATYTASFDGGASARDTTLYDNAAVVDPETPTVLVYQYAELTTHAVIAFPSLIGDAAGQLPSGSSVVSATLTFPSASGAGDVARIGVWTLAEDFVEAEATWTDRQAGVPWASPGAGTDSRAQPCGAPTLSGAALSVDVTACVADWVAGGVNAGWVLGFSGAPSDREYVSYALGSVEGASRPTLEATFVAPDRDGDGADLWEDCDDADAAVRPGTLDADRDGVDDDCDGVADEDWVPRDTGDTGLPGDTGPGDTGPAADTADVDADRDRFSHAEGDCDDADPAVHPGRDDGCDGVDADCDGDVDEDCVAAAAGAGCACGEGNAALLLALPLLGWGRRRRARGDAVATPRSRASSGARPPRTSAS